MTNTFKYLAAKGLNVNLLMTVQTTLFLKHIVFHIAVVNQHRQRGPRAERLPLKNGRRFRGSGRFLAKDYGSGAANGQSGPQPVYLLSAGVLSARLLCVLDDPQESVMGAGCEWVEMFLSHLFGSLSIAQMG